MLSSLLHSFQTSMGKPRVKIDDIDKEVKPSSSKPRKTWCIHCNYHLPSNRSDRWRSHIRSCPAASAEIKEKYPVKPSSISPTIVVAPVTSSAYISLTSDIPVPSTHDVKILSQTAKHGLEYWTDRTTKAQKEQLDMVYANIYYSTGIPF